MMNLSSFESARTEKLVPNRLLLLLLTLHIATDLNQCMRLIQLQPLAPAQTQPTLLLLLLLLIPLVSPLHPADDTGC